MTTLAIRPRSRRSSDAPTVPRPAGRDVGERARENAGREVAECIGAPLSDEQEQALRTPPAPSGSPC